MRITMPSQFVEGAAAGAEAAVEEIDEREEESMQRIADEQHAEDKADGTVKPLDAAEQKMLAELLRRDRDSPSPAAK